MSDDQAKLFSSLHASTTMMLGYDGVEHLTAAQMLRVDRAITLRLLTDDLQARQMRGEVIDVRAFVTASEDLERMVGGNPASPPAEARFGMGARARLRSLIEKTVLGPDPDAHERELARDPEGARRKFEEHLAECVAKYGSPESFNPGGVALTQTEVAPASSPPVAARGESAPVEPPPEPPRPDNVVPIDGTARANPTRPPDHYLAEHQHRNEPWRDYVYGGGGIIVAPPWPPPER
jgi:hypothetical protein